MTNEEALRLRLGNKVFIPEEHYDKVENFCLAIQEDRGGYLTVEEIRYNDDKKEYYVSVNEIISSYLYTKYLKQKDE